MRRITRLYRICRDRLGSSWVPGSSKEGSMERFIRMGLARASEEA